MTPSGQTICLCMIVKNEAPVIRRCLASVLPWIDSWLVVDTGSTDGTQGIVQDALKRLPGALLPRPWRDFGHNRSEALALARSRGDYSLIIDADDELLAPSGFCWPDLDADSYVLDIHDAGVAYRRAQLVRNALAWRYEGVLHEYLACDEARTAKPLALAMRRNHDGARRRDPETYRRDAAFLERALAGEANPFLRARYTFYLAQSRRDARDPGGALAAYLARAEMGHWDQEVFFSLYQAGRMMETLARDPDEIIATYRRASEACPSRAEAAHAASRLCRLLGRFEQGYAIARPAAPLEAPADGLFVETFVYAYGLLDELAVNAYWAGHYRECCEACLTLLSREDLPEGYRARVVANARFALEKLRDPGPTALLSAWTPPRALGGTELMAEGLRRRLGDALDAIDLRINVHDGSPKDGRPRVLWIHHDINQGPVQWLEDREKADSVDAFVFVSHWQRRRFVERFSLRAERCVVLRNATDVERENRRWSPGKPLRMAYASVPYRGLEVLLDAWDRLRPADAELHIWSSLKLYGPSFDDEAHRHIFERGRALPGVALHGLVPNDQLRAALRTIDFLTYPNLFEETSCLAAIEAMAAGCRVICPDLGALPETTNGFARIYPYQADPAAHAEAFAKVLTEEIQTPWGGDPTLAARQQDFLRETYDWSVRVSEWRAFLARIVAGGT